MSEFGKRLDGPGGRRAAARAPVLIPAAMHTVIGSRTVSLLNVSRTGARLRCTLGLHPGQEVWLQVQPSEIFGTIAWAEGEDYGIEFDAPLSEEAAAGLQARGKVMLMPRLTLDEQLAVEDWKSGFVR